MIENFAIDFTNELLSNVEQDSVIGTSVVSFASLGILESPFTTNTQTTLNVLATLDYTGGFTNHGEAISLCQDTLPPGKIHVNMIFLCFIHCFSLLHLTNIHTHHIIIYLGEKNIIVLVTDGVPTVPDLEDDGVTATTPAAYGEDAAIAAKNEGTIILPVFISTSYSGTDLTNALSYMELL